MLFIDSIAVESPTLPDVVDKADTVLIVPFLPGFVTLDIVKNVKDKKSLATVNVVTVFEEFFRENREDTYCVTTDEDKTGSNGKMWRMNMIEDVIGIFGEIDTPAEVQAVLRLRNKHAGDSYRKTSKAHEVSIKYTEEEGDSQSYCKKI